MKRTLSLLIAVSVLNVLCLSAQTNTGNDDFLWRNVKENQIPTKGNRVTMARKYRTVELNLANVEKILAEAPQEYSPIAQATETVIELPMPDGTMERFDIDNSPVMAAALAEQYPEIQTFTGKGIDDPTALVKLDMTPHGFHAMVLSGKHSTVYIDPYRDFGDTRFYICYYKSDFDANGRTISCDFETLSENGLLAREAASQLLVPQFGDCRKRTYRLALAATGEYTVARGGTVALALASMNTTMNRVNGVLEKDLAIRFNMIANTNLLIYTNGTTDPYTNTDGAILLNENQTNVTNIIGGANYDIGHVFSTGGGGIAQLGSVCNASGKARGVTGSANPTGDAFDIDYVAHEMGHQMGCNHTFNAQTGSCNGNINNSTAYEVASGCTIMAYGGICAPHNVITIGNTIDAYHYISLQEATNYMITGGGNACAVTTTLTNSAPTVSITSTAGMVLPANTPFSLTAVGADANGTGSLTYMWEQYDNGIINYPLVSTYTTGPAFRDFAPTASGTRYFPRLQELAAGTANAANYQLLPTVSRAMNFRVTVRDNNAGGGCTGQATTSVSITSTAGPFVVTAPNTNVAWPVASAQTITWSVANTDIAPVSSPTVDILLSTDGGLTYPVTIATGVPNTGTYSLNSVPNNISTTARIMVRSSNKFFFDISNVNFRITAAVNDYSLATSPANLAVCQPTNTATVNVTVGVVGTFANPVTLTWSGIPAGVTPSYTSAVVTPTTTRNVTLTGVGTAAPGNYNLTLTATASTGTRTVVVPLNIAGTGASLPIPTLSTPANNATGVSALTSLTWTSVTLASSYDVDISTNSTFTGIISSGSAITATNYTPTASLSTNTQYFWRVRARNSCGAGTYSSTFNFRTANLICSTFVATAGLPFALVDQGTISASVTVGVNGTITDVNVRNLGITHSYIGDIVATLVSPANTSVTLASRPCNAGTFANMSVTFDSESANTYASIPCPPTGGGTYNPSVTLTTLNGQNPNGTWRLNILDAAADDIGTLDSWGVEICYTPTAASTCTLAATTSATTNTGCAPQCNGAASVTATGGTAPYTYLWGNSVTTAINSGLCGGSFVNRVTVTDAAGCAVTASQVIPTSPVNPTAAITPATAVINCTNNGVTLTATGGGTYRWDNAVTTATRAVTVAGTYVVTVTGANGCTASTSRAVTGSNTPPTVVITPANPSLNCTATSVTLTATGAVTYLWNNGGSNTATTVASTPGTYTVAYTGSNGCVSSTSVVVSSNTNAPNATILANSGMLNCTASNINITATGGGTYRWDNATTAAVRNISSPGNYAVTVTGTNGCTASTSRDILQFTTAPASTTFVSPANNAGNISTVAAIEWVSVSGATGYDIDLATDPNFANIVTSGSNLSVALFNNYSILTPVFRMQPNTQYYWRVRGRNSCGVGGYSSTFTFTTGTPTCRTVSASGLPVNLTDNATTAVSFNVPFVGTVTDVNIPELGMFHQNIADIYANLVHDGLQTLLFNQVCNQPNMINFLAGFDSDSPNPNANIPCPPVDGLIYQPISNLGFWNNREVNGNWGLSTSDVNAGSTGTLAVWSLELCYIEAPQCSLTASTSTVANTGCPGACNGSVSVTPSSGTAPYNYLWSNGATTASITGLCGGGTTYTVTATDAVGCTAAASRVVTSTVPLAAISSTSSQLNCTATSVTLTASGGGTYRWNNNATTATRVVTTAGTYTVTVTTTGGCTSTASITLQRITTAPGSVTLSSPANTSTGITLQPTLVWSSVTLADGYDVDISTNSGFTGIVASGSSIAGTSFSPSAFLSSNTQYFWRVRARNSCGVSSYSSTFSFTTTNFVCSTFVATGFPFLILDQSTFSSSLNVNVNGTITDVNVRNLSITHTYIGDIVASLTSPSNSTVTLANRLCNINPGYPNLALDFDSESANAYTAIPCPPVGGGTYAPSSSLAGFNGQSPNGNWRLNIQDAAAQDVGTLDSWSLEVCYTPAAPVCNISLSGVTSALNTGCAPNCNGAAGVTATGGTAPYTYAWSNGATTQNLTGLCGDLDITVTDALGCTATLTQIVDSNPTFPTAGITPASAVLTCATRSVTLTATGGGTYRWDNAATTAARAVTAAGTFTVTVTGANGCTASASRTVTANTTAPTAGITPASPVLNCTTTSVTLTATGGGTYRWDNAATTAARAVTAAGNYIVTVTGTNGCTATANRSVTANVTPPTAAITTTNSVINCTATSVTLTATGGASYLWATGLTTQNFVTSAATLVTVTVTGSNGCIATASAGTSVNTALPNATISPTTAALNCTTTSVTLTASGGGTYLWDNASTSAARVVTAAGAYLVTVTGTNGCTATASRTVTSNTTAPTAGITPATSVLSCTTVSATLTASGGTSYLWDNGTTTAARVVTAAGTYTVTVSNANGCTASASRTVTSNTNPPTAGITPASAVLNCTTTSVTLTATGGGTYRWDNATTTAARAVTAAGTYIVTVTGTNGCTATTSRTVTANTTAPNASITQTASELNCTFTSISLTASGGGTYRWDNAATTAARAVTAAGTFTVTVTGTNGCTATASTSVTSNTAAPTAAISPTIAALNCTTTSVTLTASGGGTYLWDNASTSAARVTTAAGTYLVTVTGTNGCTATASRTVTSNTTAPTVGITPATSVLSCTTVSATLTASGGTSYLWDNGTTTAARVVTAAGTYTVTVSNANGCTASASRTVTANTTPPTAGITPASPVLNCTTTSVTLTATGGGTYRWDNAATTAARAVTAAGTYTVTVRGTNGCTATASRTVTANTTVPNASIAQTASELNCTLTSISLTASGGGTYRWDNAATTAARAVTAAGTFTVTVTGTNGCTATASTSITSNTTAPAAAISASSNELNCTATSVTLTATGGGTYRWDNATTLATRTITTAGNYRVTVTSANGCTATASVSISSNTTAPTAAVSPATAALNCTTTSVSLTATGGGSYLWDNGVTTATRVASAAGAYRVTVTSDNGCTATASASVSANSSLPNATITQSASVLNCNNRSITLTAAGGGTYLWDNNTTSATRVITAAGSYTVTVTSTNGCAAFANVVISSDFAAPMAMITPSSATLTCSNPSVTLTSMAGSGVWSNGSTGSSIVVTSAGTYSLTVTGSNGCTASTSAQISADFAAPMAMITPANPVLNCSNPSITLTSMGGSGVWSNGTTGSSIVVTAAGTYGLTLTGTNGCTASTSIQVTSNFTAPTVSLVSSALNVGCAVSSVTLTASSNASLTWSNGSTAQTLVVTAAGTYTVTATSSNGCTSTASVSVGANIGSHTGFAFTSNQAYTNSSFPATLSMVGFDFNNYTYRLMNVTTGAFIQNMTTPTYTDRVGGLFRVEWTSRATVCTGISNKVKVIFDPNYGFPISTSGVVANKPSNGKVTSQDNGATLQLGDFVALFPNPASAELNINLDAEWNQPTQLAIYSAEGRMLWNLDATNTSDLLKVDVSEWSSGLYILRAISNEQTATIKFQVIR